MGHPLWETSRKKLKKHSFKKIFVAFLTRAPCSVRATAYLSKSQWKFFKKNMVNSYYRGSSLSTIFGILKKLYYAKFLLVSTLYAISKIPPNIPEVLPLVFPKYSKSIPQSVPWIFPRYSAVFLQVLLEYSPIIRPSILSLSIPPIILWVFAKISPVNPQWTSRNPQFAATK